MNEDTYRILEYGQIKEQLASFTMSGLGRRLVAGLEPSADARTVEQRLRETSEARAILDASGHPPFAGLSDVTEQMERLDRGAVLEPAALIALADFLRGCRKVKTFMERFTGMAPQICAYARSITCFEELEQEIELCIENGRVSNAASSILAKVRARMETVKGRIQSKMASYLTSNRFGDCLQENIITVKEGRYCLAVKSSHRQKLDGMVVATSGSGQTVFFEPAAVRDLTNQLKVLAAEEEAEEYKVLARLSNEVAARREAVGLNIETMAAYDFAFAKAKYSRALDGVPAELLPEPRMAIRRGRHPLLGREAVPLDFHIGGGYRTLLITGPNTGGKTVALKTIGLFALMIQSGLHVPAGRGTKAGVFDRVLADIGDRQSIEQSLSTFSGHMENVVKILEAAGGRSLVLLDEIGTGTDPAEGAALGAAVLEDLHAAGAVVVATTHYGDLKRFAGSRQGFRNGCMEFDPDTLRPLFRLRIGRAGQSNGIWIAERLGMRPGTLAKAKLYLESRQPSVPVPEQEEQADEFDEHEEWHGESFSQEPAQAAGEPDPGDETPPAPRPFQVGDSVYVGTLGEKGILAGIADAKGDVTVLVRGKRLKVNEKRIKLHIPKEQLYPDPENYDLRIVLLSKDDRRLDNAMKKRHVEGKMRIIDK